MPSVSALIRSAWQRFLQTAALNDNVLWLLALPVLGITICERLGGLNGADPYWLGYTPSASAWLPFFVITVFLNVLIMWGTAVVLVIASRKEPLSFLAARRLALPLILPILLTEILRFCFTFLWLFALILPGLLYSLRTMFVEPIIVKEGLTYRPALKRSIALVKGRLWEVGWTAFATAFLIFFPIGFVIGFAEGIIGVIDPRLLAVTDSLQALVSGITTTLYLFVLMAMYEHLAAHHHRHAST